YFKNMVRDANGQYSISYVDMHGRTVATALAGKPATSMDSLESGRLIYVTKKLVDSTNNIIKGAVIESSKSLVVTKAGVHNFHYTLATDSLKLKGCDTGSVCYDCLYNLQITISDDCNNQTLPGGVPVVVTDSNFTIGHIDTLCNTLVGFDRSFSQTLQEGTYTITKRLTVSKYGMDYYRDSIFLKHNTCRSITDFIREQQQLLLQTSCMPSCEHCSIDTFSNWTLYRPYYMTQLGLAPSDTAAYRNQAQLAFNSQRQACDNVCGNTLISTSIHNQMLTDLTPPYGQYANPDKIDGYSIFVKDNSGYYRYKGTSFTNEEGNPDLVSTANVTNADPGLLTLPDFVSNFKPTWAENMLPLHPEYCKLKLYETNPSFTTSHAWDNSFAAVNTYSQALAAGYLNPLGYTNAPVSASSTIRDPFFNSTNNPTYASTWRSVLNDSMRQKVPKAGGGYVDMWSLATAMAQCSTNDNACVSHYSDNTHPFDIDTSCGGTLDMAWRYFREMYLEDKREILTKILDQACGLPSVDLAGNHVLNFPEPGTLTAQMPADPTSGAAGITSLVNSSCAGYVTQWWLDLGPCNYTAADSLVITPRLIKVCQEGGDNAHPFGSSTVNPSSTYTYKSFDDVLKAYNDSLATAPSPRSIGRSQCNGYLLSAPGAYDNTPVYSNLDLWTKPDSCQCSTITTLYTQYLGYGKTDANFAAYLLRTTGTTMSGSTLDSLRQLCSGQITCKALKAPISLPPVLQCGVHDVCATCLQVNSLYTQYTTSFPGALPAYDNTDSIQRVNNHLFENFMNKKLGFGMQASDYLVFMDTCQITHNGPAITSCDSLQALKNDFIKYNGRIPHLDSTGADTTYLKWDNKLGPSLYTMGYPFAPTFNNGILHIPDAYAATVIGNYVELSFSHDTLCVDTSGFTFETRIKLPDSLIRTNGFDNTSWWIKVTGNAPAGQILFASDTIRTVVVASNTATLTPPPVHFNDWRVLKIKVRGRNVNCYIDDTLRVQGTLAAPMSKIYWWSLGQWSYNASIDYVRIYDTSGRTYYDEEFTDPHNLSYPTTLGDCSDCTTRFTTYYNKRKGTSYTFSQIDSIYYQKCGTHVNPCPTTPSFRDSLQQLENDYLKYNGRIPKL
ncbi:MAG TPA: hypothetical protein VLD19_10075, partial [Chitinophagaceae bacterium]|nr:hypothetical protein [Chitinophagaceae bacterium]